MTGGFPRRNILSMSATHILPPESRDLTIDGLTVRVTVERDEHGPRVVLHGLNCDLDGEAPGLYYLTPSNPCPAGGYPDNDFERGFRAGARDYATGREFDGEIASDPSAPFTVGYCAGWEHGDSCAVTEAEVAS